MRPEQVLEILQACLPASTGSTVALHEPRFEGNEWFYVKECLDTGWVSSAGKYVDSFEEKLAEFTGIKRAVATVNGTAALHICLKLAEVQANDEVLVPALTFIATANAVSYCGAIPHFIDSAPDTLGVDPLALAEYLKNLAEVRGDDCFNKLSGRRIRALVAMHTFGHPVDLEPLAELCQRYKIVLIEDAAESLGSYYKGHHTGRWGKLAALSFNGNKTITTGGGGAILTNDTELGQKAKHLTTTARVGRKHWEFWHDEVGYNYRLPNLNAALGCAQLEALPSILERKRALAERYQKAFAAQKGLRFFQEADFAKSNYWLNALILDKPYLDERDRILELTNKAGIMTRPVWTLMPKLPMYQNCPRMNLPVAELLEAALINIPSSPFL